MPSSRTDADACAFLDADHKAVRQLFKAYEDLVQSRARDAARKKQALAAEICSELTVHARLEEEVFYPALRKALKDTDALAEAEVEHATLKDLVARLDGSDGADEAFDACVKVLSEYVEHHVKEERRVIFPRARAARGLDLVAMRDDLRAFKEELTGTQEA